jgi:hypothetical protein
MRLRETVPTLVLLTWVVASAPAHAQRVTRAVMPRGEVTGLELALEGATSVPEGSSLRWFITLYEVVGHDALRPARNGRVRVLASFRPDDTIADVRMDQHGRAEVAVPVPPDYFDEFEVVLEARSGAVARTFRTNVTPVASGRVELVADRASVQPGERIAVVGRAVISASGRPVAGRAVSIVVADQDGRRLETRDDLVTGPSGVFGAVVEAPDGVASIQVRAIVDGIGDEVVSVSVATREAPRLIVRAVPSKRLVVPGDAVPIDIMARRADGRPVRGARVGVERIDVTAPERDVRTDESGRVRLVWRIPNDPGDEAITALEGSVTVERAGLGTASTTVAVRVAREGLQIGVSAEGGSLLPGLPSRLFVRAVSAQGEPVRDALVRVEGPLVGDLRGRTDDTGVVVLDATPVVRPGIEGRDRCGGTTASSVVITVGEEDDSPSEERCLPVDPDGTVRVRPASHVLEARGRIDLELHPSEAVSGSPIELVLLVTDGERRFPVARRVVAAGVRRASLDLPDDVAGEVILRARPLIGGSFEPVRGSMAALWVTPGPWTSVTLDVADGGASIGLSEPRDGAEGAVLAVPADEAADLVERVRTAMLPPIARLLGDPAHADLVRGWLASRTPRDDAAPAVLAGGTVVVMPAPETPEDLGVLRDPVRVRARFVRGRLALVVRTLERRLEDAIPDRVSDVGVHGTSGWTFNREALTAVVGAHLLENTVPMTLGGDPLTLDDLEALDGSFTFDNLARRVTRRRLLALLVRLRDFVQNRDLDLWQQTGDPALWLRLLVEDEAMEETGLLDAWGRPMEIRRAPGGRARFELLTPLPRGYELVSAGPDGRAGTADDLYDPFARVLPSGSPYAEAVGEDDLLARLDRVEMSQATLEAVVGIFEIEPSQDDGAGNQTAARTWADLPEPLAEVGIEAVDRFDRPWTPVVRSPAGPALVTREARFAITVGDEPRAYTLISLVWTAEGWLAVGRAPYRAGFPVLVSAEPVERLHPREPLLVPVAVAALPGAPSDVRLSLEQEGVAHAAFQGLGDDGSVALGPGGAALPLLRVWSESEGEGVVRLRAWSPGSDQARTVELPVHVRADGSLRAQSAAAAATGPVTMTIDLPRDAVLPRGELVLARPGAMLGDPSFDRWLETDPALAAWALAVSGQPIPEHVVRRLEAATRREGSVEGEEPVLSTACAAVAWAATTEGMHWAPAATASFLARMRGDAAASSTTSTDAALLAALGVAAAPDGSSTLSLTIAQLRDAVRSLARGHRNDPGLLARGAAALLLADHRDVRGRTMLALAREHLVPGFRGGLAVDTTTDDENGEDQGRAGVEQLAATAALAIAAHQAGERDLALGLARGMAARAHVATDLGGESLFWVLAARAFGVLGAGDSIAVNVEQGGTSRRVVLGAEAVVLPLALPGAGRRTSVRVTPLDESDAVPLVRATARYVRPARAVEAGPLRSAISGDPGFAGERAAFAVTISNTSGAPVELPVLLVTLPAGARLDAIAREAMTASRGVRSVDEPDARGVVRVRLARLGAAGEVRLPVPLLWTAAGSRRGLTLAAFPADRAWQLSVTPPIEIDVGFRPEEE